MMRDAKRSGERDMMEINNRLLTPDDPHPVSVERPDGASPVFLACDHAGNRIPGRLDSLGVADAELRRHIAWDPGAAEVARGLSARLDATLVLQAYSRLVIDCNRATHRPDSIATVSEHTGIPGNRDLHPDLAAARAREIFHPYHDTIVAALDARRANGRQSILFCVHSFTPVYKGEQRPWHVGLLYNRDDRLARALMTLMGEEPGLCIGDNQPYAISDESDYTIPVHGEQRGIPHVEVEIRHDLIETPEGQRHWAGRLEAWLTAALARLAGSSAGF
jgi:predicted N-formylglutamate amidohydrolase